MNGDDSTLDQTWMPLVGPIQLVVIGFPPGAQFRGEILRAFASIRGRGVIRLIDALFVRKDERGDVSAMMRESDLTTEQREVLGAIVGHLLALDAGGDQESQRQLGAQAAQAIAEGAFGLGLSDLQHLKDSIPADGAALVLLIEHQWALELKDAVRRAGGVPLIQGLLTPEALLLVGAEVRAVTEAEDTIALARAAEGAAVLSALATVEAAEQVQQAAVAETASVLMSAGLIEEAAAQDVVETLVAADLIKQEALAEARAMVEQASAEVAAVTQAQASTSGETTGREAREV